MLWCLISVAIVNMCVFVIRDGLAILYSCNLCFCMLETRDTELLHAVFIFGVCVCTVCLRVVIRGGGV